MTDAISKNDIDFLEVQSVLDGPCKSAAQGLDVAVICKDHYDRNRKAKAVFDALGGIGELRQGSIKFPSGGTCEFVSILSGSGRRADDFDDHAFML